MRGDTRQTRVSDTRFEKKKDRKEGFKGMRKPEKKKEPLTTLPARPPAIKAKLINKRSLALQTAFESPSPSSPRTRSLSIKLTTSIPRREQIPGTQSTNVTCTNTGSVSWGGRACAERIAASRKVQLAMANYRPRPCGIHENAGEAHTCDSTEQ